MMNIQYGKYEISSGGVPCQDDERRVDGSVMSALRRPDEVQIYGDVRQKLLHNRHTVLTCGENVVQGAGEGVLGCQSVVDGYVAPFSIVPPVDSPG